MRTCSKKDCEKTARKRGMCGTHYAQEWRGRAFEVTKRLPADQRFWGYVSRGTGPDECWPWNAAKNKHGYGRFMWQGKQCQAHRVAYELSVGAIPEGLELDHLCHTRDLACRGGGTCPHRKCVNPNHLEPVVQRTNLLRGRSPAAQHSRKTACPRGHDYDEANTFYAVNGSRRCRTCIRAKTSARAAEEKRIRHERVGAAVCKVCGKPFTHMGRPKRLCSRECVEENGRAHARECARRKREEVRKRLL